MRFQEKIGTLTKISGIQVQLAGFNLVKLGGQFKSLISPILLTSISGIGGIDTGTIAASSFYYVYAVSNGVSEGIVASLNKNLPFNFTRYRKVGAFSTNSLSQVSVVYDGSSGVLFISDNVKLSQPSAWGSSYTTTPRFGSIDDLVEGGLLSYTNDPVNGSIITVLKECIVTAIFQHGGQTLNNTTLSLGVSRNGTNTPNQSNKVNQFGNTQKGNASTTETPALTVGGSLRCFPGDIIRAHSSTQVMSYGSVYSNFSVTANLVEGI